MYPTLFKIGTVTVYTHGLLAVLGILVGAAILFFLARGRKLDTQYLFDNLVYSILAGIIGARLTYYFLYPDQFSSWREIFFLWQGGMVSYGGFIIGGLSLWALLKMQKEPVLKWLDITALAFIPGLILGRVGNIMAGEYSGVMAKSRFNLGGLVPIPLLEIFLLVAIGGILIIIYRFYSRKISGLIFGLLALLYPLGRFVIDFWRDESKMLWRLSAGQITGLALAILAIIFIYYIYRQNIKLKRIGGKNAI